MAPPPTTDRPIASAGPHWAPGAAVVAALGAWLAIYLPLLPGPGGRMGHDWAQHLPNLMAGLYFKLASGPLAVPWFTPSQCGGLPFYADPNVGYFSLPQQLVGMMPPVAAAQLTLCTFAAAGALGAWLLLRRGFGLGPWPAALGSALFLFHGFFPHRMLIGHLTFHAFPLVALAAWAALDPARSPTHRLLLTAVIAACGGYMAHSGMSHGLLPAAVSVGICVALRGLTRPEEAIPWGRILVGGMWGAALGVGKLAAGLAWLSHFPRDDYRLPGFDGLFQAGAEVIRALFVDGGAERARLSIVNNQWAVDRHELEYGISWVALVPIFLYLILRLRRGQGEPILTGPRWRTRGLLLALLGLGLLPVILNTHTPGLEALYKHIPILRSSSSLLRFIAALGLPAAVLSALALAGAVRAPWRLALTTGGLLVALALSQAAVDRGYYADQSYTADGPQRAWQSAMERGEPPPITWIGGRLGEDGQVMMTLDRNEALFEGASQLACYQAIFGYRLEHFPVGDLHFGPVAEVIGGHLNLKDPSCYLFPEANGCQPGDPLSAAREADAAAFTTYHPLPFHKPGAQRAADGLSLAALILLGLALPGAWWLDRRGGSKRGAEVG